MKLGKIENDTITQIAVFDPENVPLWADTWIDATDLEVGMVDDGNGNFINPEETAPTAEELDDARSKAYDRIDTSAEKARLRFVTDGAAQAMTYQLKGDDAAKYISDGYPVDYSTYPFVQAEVQATGKTATDAANDIVAQRDLWISVGATIEKERIGGKNAVLTTTDLEGIQLVTKSAINILDAI